MAILCDGTCCSLYLILTNSSTIIACIGIDWCFVGYWCLSLSWTLGDCSVGIWILGGACILLNTHRDDVFSCLAEFWNSEVSCSSDFIVYVVVWNKGPDGEWLLWASVSYKAAFFAASTAGRVGNFALDGKTIPCRQWVRPTFWWHILSINGSGVVHFRHTIPWLHMGPMIHVVVIYHGLLLDRPAVPWGWRHSWTVYWVGILLKVLYLLWIFVEDSTLLPLVEIICPASGLGISCQWLPDPS